MTIQPPPSRTNTHSRAPGARLVAVLAAAGAAVLGGPCLAGAAESAGAALSAPPALTTTVGLAAKETYDTNVYTQDVTPLAFQRSWLTTVTPSIVTAFDPYPLLAGSLGYAPEFDSYASAHGEDYSRQVMTGALNGKDDAFSYVWMGCLTPVDGAKTGATYTGPGGAPAIGGVDRMNRRDQTVSTSSLAVSYAQDGLLLRPVASFREQDYHIATSTAAGYQNLVDRAEWVSGVDLGTTVLPGITPFVSVRYGRQAQDNLLGVVNNFSNEIHRYVAGLEGSPAPWIRLSLLAGEDERKFTAAAVNIPSGNRDKFYSNSTATLTPTKSDTITLAYIRFLQPAFVGRNAYEDITADLQWKHALGAGFTAGAGYTEHDGFYETGNRHDRIHTGSGSLAYALSKLTSVTLGYSYDGTTTDVPAVANTSGRNFDRNLFALGVKTVF